MNRPASTAARRLAVVATAVAGLATGCGDDLGGVQARPSVAIKVSELDDEDVPRVSRGEAGSLGIEVPILAPDGSVILPPELREDAAAATTDAADE